MIAVRRRHSGNAMNFFSSPQADVASKPRAWAGVPARPRGSARTLVESCEVGHSSASAAMDRGAQAFELLLGFAQGRLEGANAEAREMAFIWFTKRLPGNNSGLSERGARQFRWLIERLRPGITLRE